MLRFLLDEHLRGPLWVAIMRHNAQSTLPVDVVRVGDPPDLPLGSSDPAILLWAERESRILLSEDLHTLPGHLAEHVQAGHRSPGVFMIHRGCSIGQLVNHLELVAHVGEPADLRELHHVYSMNLLRGSEPSGRASTRSSPVQWFPRRCQRRVKRAATRI